MRSERLFLTAADDSGTWLRPAVQSLARQLRAHHQPAGHGTHRLARTVRRVADRMGLDPLEATEAELVAILHHAGRLAVPAGLLGAPGILTELQRDIVRARTIAAADLLARRAGLDELAATVRHVHERWDGSGHPSGLAGEEIPMPARIVAVVDAHLVLLQGDPGCPAPAPHATRLRLAVEAGWRLDPAVVRAYLDELHDQPEKRFTRAVPPAPPQPLVP
jgi:response regulator RpfG family c-di-GMP phosphodiesterase